MQSTADRDLGDENDFEGDYPDFYPEPLRFAEPDCEDDPGDEQPEESE